MIYAYREKFEENMFPVAVVSCLAGSVAVVVAHGSHPDE